MQLKGALTLQIKCLWVNAAAYRIWTSTGGQHARIGGRFYNACESYFLNFDSAMADESSLSRQIESMERSMVFLRQEHLTLLHGLHLEILSLQKRCSELTSELKVKPPGRSQMGMF
ncbi:coiled-coil domain-containing protein 92 isoform X1 [Lates japonicus]|uniref:Coiled-coil domain-containing protein 92 isoform X1 n=1 Tax=Lates japonicus TaxID=270547 RepID=A0AAD3MJH2_LATJO|nr:coiled-coil domain-containing protein 92 isoform X1 [Lates japonicus]